MCFLDLLAVSSLLFYQRALDEWLETRFLTGACGADIWPDHAEINRQVQKWTMTRVAVDEATSIRLLQEKWCLPARSSIPGRDGDDAGRQKAKTRACRYLNRRVSHFFQRIGDRVSASYTMKLFHLTGMGVLRRARADRPKMEVFLSNNLAADLLADDEFITDADSRTALLHAGIEVFKSFGEANRFSEPCRTPTGHSTGSVALVCLQSHLAVFTTKVREHLKLRQRVPGTGPRSNFNTGHRQTWEAEIEILNEHLISQGARQRNGLRLVDGNKDHRALSVRPPGVAEPPVPLSIASSLEAFGAADRVWNQFATSRPYGVRPLPSQQAAGIGGVEAGVGGRSAGETEDIGGIGVDQPGRTMAAPWGSSMAGNVAAASSAAAGGSAAAAAAAADGGSAADGVFYDNAAHGLNGSRGLGTSM